MMKNYEPTESEKQRDKENSRREYQSNMTKSYRNKNRGLDIKIEAMEILRKRLVELDEELDSQQSSTLSRSERLKIMAVMAQLGNAIIPD
ncbi:MAG: hypothetical protein V8R67_08690 [Eubacterium sp.]